MTINSSWVTLQAYTEWPSQWKRCVVLPSVAHTLQPTVRSQYVNFRNLKLIDETLILKSINSSWSIGKIKGTEYIYLTYLLLRPSLTAFSGELLQLILSPCLLHLPGYVINSIFHIFFSCPVNLLCIFFHLSVSFVRTKVVSVLFITVCPMPSTVSAQEYLKNDRQRKRWGKDRKENKLYFQ